MEWDNKYSVNNNELHHIRLHFTIRNHFSPGQEKRRLQRQRGLGMTYSCDDAPPEGLLRAIGEFNRGDWFDCHETLEELWAGEQGEMRDFYQGLLQVAVALHHWRNGNLKGALFLLKEGAKRLRHVRPVCREVDADGLAGAAERLLEALTTLGPERMEELDYSLIPKLRLVGHGG